MRKQILAEENVYLYTQYMTDEGNILSVMQIYTK